MISCDAFRNRFAPGSDDAALLEHLRSCDACLQVAAEIDPDSMFRALGGEMIPPGGVDAFVDDVMRQIRLRDAESSLQSAKVVAWPRRLAIAATLALTITGAAVVYERLASDEPAASVRVAVTKLAPVKQIALTTKPVVETYQAENATIIELPTEGAENVKMVMIFDESLPADL